MNEPGELKVNLHQLLKTMIEKGASDMHITTGTPPLLRIDGSIVPLKLPPLGPIETKALCFTVLTEEQRAQFEKHNELDLSFGVKGLSRFRANIFMQRGERRRRVPHDPVQDPHVRRARAAADRRRVREQAERPGARDRARPARASRRRSRR